MWTWQVGRQIEGFHADRGLFQGAKLGLMWLKFLSVFIPGCVEETSDGGLCVRVASNVCLAVPAEKLSTYARYKNAKVEIGIRPEHIHEGSTGAVGTSFQVMVDMVEPTGADTIVVFSLDGTLVTARGRPYGMSKAGESGAFTIDVKNAHLIEPISEKVIYHG